MRSSSLRLGPRSQIVFPHELNLKAYVKETGIAAGNGDDLKALCADARVRDAILKELNLVGKKAGLKPLEVRSALAHALWS